MSDVTTNLKAEIQKGLSQMQTLRDEVRVRLHLAGMEVKEEWQKLEPTIDEVERKAEQVSDATRAAIDEAVKKIAKIRSSLH